jgi:uncharacterized membrane protein
METNRLEAFSDGVLAIIITIMVLELKAPHEAGWEVLAALTPEFLSYVLSFAYVGIYWNNHHHLLKTARRVNGAILWTNLLLLFWLSLIPFATAWMARTHFGNTAVTLYGVILLLCGITYFLLQHAIIRGHGDEGVLRKALGSDWKGKSSVLLYSAAIVLSLWWRWPAFAIYVAIAMLWLIPDRRIERVVG